MKENIKDQLKEGKQSKTKEEYKYLKIADLPLIRASIQGIPYVGGPLDTLLFSKARKIKEARIQDLIRGLKKDFLKIKEEVIDKNYLESEDFLSIVEKIFKEVTIEANKQKRIYLKNALKNSTLKENSNYNKNIFIDLLHQVSSFHVFILKTCINLSTKQNTKVINLQNLRKTINVLNFETDIEYLVSLGLISKKIDVSDASGELSKYKVIDIEINSSSYYEINEFSKRFIQFVEK
jgi:hypothetical protein